MHYQQLVLINVFLFFVGILAFIVTGQFSQEAKKERACDPGLELGTSVEMSLFVSALPTIYWSRLTFIALL